MPKGKKSKTRKKAKSKRAQPNDPGLHKFSADLQIGNNDPSVVFGKLYGGMPNASRKATGRIRAQRGKRGV